MHITIRAFLGGLAVALLTPCTPAGAAVYRTCDGDKVTWESSWVEYRVSNISFPPRSAANTALKRAWTGWNSYSPGSVFHFVFRSVGDTSWSSGDGRNSIAFTSDYGWGSGTLAVTMLRFDPCWWFDDGSIIETDVMFNPGRTWNFASYPAPDVRANSLALVAAHELGHALGLLHEDTRMATMNSFYPDSGVLGNNNDPDPHADDVAGSRFLYGASSSTSRDLAMSVFKRTGAGTSALISAPTTARKGSIRTLSFTFSNRGTIRENSVVRVYASSDRRITTSDRFLGEMALWADPGFEGTFTVTLPIPTTLVTGYYYLGFVADPGSTIPETDEDNNGVGYTTRTYIY